MDEKKIVEQQQKTLELAEFLELAESLLGQVTSMLSEEKKMKNNELEVD